MYDFALDPATGDWLWTANTDIQGVAGVQVVQQRILTRLKMSQGWILDPTKGALGSRLRVSTRLPRGRAMRELPLMTREALAPMRDVSVQEVWIEENPNDVNSVILRIDYVTIDEVTGPVLNQAQESLAIELGVI